MAITYPFLKCLRIASSTPSICMSSDAALGSGPYIQKYWNYIANEIYKKKKMKKMKKGWSPLEECLQPKAIRL